MDMAEIELDSEDLNLVDDIFNAVAFDVDGQVSAGDVRHILEEMKDRQITQGVLKKLGDVERKIHYKDLMDIIKTGLKIYKMVEGRVSRIKVSEDTPTLLTNNEQEKDSSVLATGLKIDILRMFSRMDPDNSGFVEEPEFEAYTRDQQLGMSEARIKQLYHTIKNCTIMEGPAEDQGITYQDLLCYFETHGDAAEMRREKCDQEEGGVCSRWKPFEAFRREVQGEEVMTSTDDGILRDYLPGTYPMAEIVQFTDLPDLLPARASVPGVRWEEGGKGSFARLIFPVGFDGQVPSEIASTETLGYYGARIAESCKSENVTLSARHCLDDYTYHPQYLHKWVERSGGGAGLEFHDFSHLDCPLDSPTSSGHYVLAKFTGFPAPMSLLCLEITAFQVPQRHSVFTPGGVLHSNNYLRGTWRTMLSDQDIHEAKLEKGGKQFSFKIK